MSNPFEVINGRLDSIETLLLDIKHPTDKSQKVNESTEIISRDELCKRLNITTPTAIRWAKKGLIPSFSIGSSIRYNWPKVIEALENKKEAKK
jgi:hypothetical protein